MEELKNNSFYVLVTHAKQDCLDLKTCFTTYPFLNGDFTSPFKAVARKYIFMESLNTSKYIHYVHSDIAMKDII